MKRYKSSRMIRMEYLNHRGNLYAGQAIEWMIENSFIVVNCEYGDPADGRPVAHGITLDEPADGEEAGWRAEAESFFTKQ